MPPRSPITTIRSLPPWALLCLVAVVSAAALLAACGGSGGGSPPTPVATLTSTAPPSPASSPVTTPTAAPPATTTLSLYLLRGEKLGVAERQVPQSTKPATAAIEALCAGPSASESAAGLTSAVPSGTRLLGLSLDGTTARVDLSAQFATGGGSLSMQARVAQVVYTLTQFRTIRTVAFMLEGNALDALGGEGLILSEGQRRADWRGFEPAIFVERPGVGAVLSSPFALSGTASVFEGSFAARLVDGAGQNIVRAQVQASAGAPELGHFRVTLPFSTAAQNGTLVVFSQSMEDGSRQDEVRIPVSFALE
jgi:germination protein M